MFLDKEAKYFIYETLKVYMQSFHFERSLTDSGEDLRFS